MEDEESRRRDLAACFRLAASFGWDDLVFTHFTARVPGPAHHFLINPSELMFDEIRACDLIKVDIDGQIVAETPYSVPPAGFVVHSGIHAARDDAQFVMHLHGRAGTAVASLDCGLLPLTQTAMLRCDDVASHEFEGVALRLDERDRLRDDLGDRHLMLLRNHGTLGIGRTAGEVFLRMYRLEWACDVQLRMLATGQAAHPVATEAREGVAAILRAQSAPSASSKLVWEALLRRLDRTAPDYAH